jgi:hypothetical protein
MVGTPFPSDNYLVGSQGCVGVVLVSTLDPTTGELSDTITNVKPAADGTIDVTAPSVSGLKSGDIVLISNVDGTVEANGVWQINIVDATTFNLIESHFTNAYAGGGTVSLAMAFKNWKLSMKAALPKQTNVSVAGYQTVLSGIISAQLTASGPYNNSHVGLVVGDTYLWFLGFTDSISINVPAAVETLEPSVDVFEVAMLTMTAQSNGAFYATIK